MDLHEEDDDGLSLSVAEVLAGPRDVEGFRPLRVETNRGRIHLRLYEAPDARAGVVWLGGVGGGFDTPARGLYPRLCKELMSHGISSCRVNFRNTQSLEEALLDTLVAVSALAEIGCTRSGIVGHSFGGAVALQTAAIVPHVSTVVTLATQSAGATVASELSGTQSVLLLHGSDDEVLPPICSRTVARLVPGRKRMVLLPKAHHTLDDASDDVTTLVRRWLLAELGGDGLGSVA